MILVYFASPISRDDEEQGSANDCMFFLYFRFNWNALLYKKAKLPIEKKKQKARLKFQS